MILGYLLSCAGGCGLRMLVSTRIPHWCDTCRDRSEVAQ